MLRLLERCCPPLWRRRRRLDVRMLDEGRPSREEMRTIDHGEITPVRLVGEGAQPNGVSSNCLRSCIGTSPAGESETEGVRARCASYSAFEPATTYVDLACPMPITPTTEAGPPALPAIEASPPPPVGADEADAATAGGEPAAKTAATAGGDGGEPTAETPKRGPSMPTEAGSRLASARLRAAGAAVMSDVALERELSRLPNRNRVCEYEWAALLLAAIATNAPPAVSDLGSGARGTPLFVVAGACPNPFCGMQAVLYNAMRPASAPADAWSNAWMDFWWVKPHAEKRGMLQKETLDRHEKGPHKNDPGRSRAFYVQFADLFALDGNAEASMRAERAGGGALRFEVAQVGGGSRRAIIRQIRSGDAYYVYFIWQADPPPHTHTALCMRSARACRNRPSD